MPSPRRPRIHAEPPPGSVTLSQDEFEALADQANANLPVTIPEEEEIEETAADRVARMLAGIGDDPEQRAIVKLYKIIGPNKFGWCDEYKVDVFEEGGVKMIREQWGPGEYQIRLYASRPGDRKSYAVRAKENLTILAQQTNSVGAPAPSAENGAIRALIDGQQKLLEAIANRPAADPMATMKETLTLMTMLKTVMGESGGGSSRGSLVDQLDEMRKLKEFVGELADGDGGKKEPSILELAGDVVKMVGAVSGPRAAPGAPAAPRRVMQTPPVRLISNPPPNAPAASPVVQPQEPHDAAESDTQVSAFDLLLMRKTLLKLVSQAEAKIDPEEGAATLAGAVDMLEEQDAAFAMLEADEWWEVLQKLAPDTAPHKDWFTQVRAMTLALFPVDDEPGGSDDAPQAANDADLPKQSAG